jgi:hypothetical protein
MNVTQISACPLRIRIDNQTNGSGGAGTGQDFELANLGDQYAVFVKVENTSQTPENPTS